MNKRISLYLLISFYLFISPFKSFLQDPLIEWENTIGGLSSDFLAASLQTSDGGYILGGLSFSGISGDKTEALLGGFDYWVVKLFSEDCIPSRFYADADGDNYGNNIIDTSSCLAFISGYVSDSTDCDDTNPNIYPSATEILDGLDNNCNGSIDEGLIDVNTMLSDELFSLHPNRANDMIKVETYYNTSKTIYLTDALCQIVQTIITSENSITINLNNISSGIYFIKMEDGINSTTQKFIKQ